MSNNDSNKIYYEQYVKKANERAYVNQNAQDKTILLTSLVVLGIIVIAFDHLFVYPKLKFYYITFIISDILALMSIILSYVFCYKGNIKDIYYAERYYLHNDISCFNRQSIHSKIGEWLNVFALLSILTTLLLFSIIICMKMTPYYP